jgi:NADH-quinone oxidoreductase subunit G
VVVGAEPELDCADGAQALAATGQGGGYRGADAVQVAGHAGLRRRASADSALCETSGTFVNTEGRVQSFHAAAKPLGDARPAWKVLRVLGNLLASLASTTTAART